MGNMATDPSREMTTQDQVERWWPVAVAIAAGAVIPIVGIPLALVMAFIRRWDRPVMITLLVIAAISALLLRVVLTAGGEGVGTGV